MKSILFIIGSLRTKSFNRQLAMMVKEIIGNRAEVSELDYSDLPLLNQDIEQPEPAAVARIRKAVSEADALWIFTPEYNSSYPGPVKNMIDWLSRPVIPLDYGTPTCINGKRVAISGAGGKATVAPNSLNCLPSSRLMCLLSRRASLFPLRLGERISSPSLTNRKRNYAAKQMR